MTEEEKLKIDEEYEKLVPPIKHENIFDDNEDYESFRQYIIDQPRYAIQNKKLPFRGIKVTSYIEFKKQDVIEREEQSGKHIFYIKQSRKGQDDFCDAAGYFIRQTKGFVVLPYSHIINEAQGYFPKGYKRYGNLDGINLYTIDALSFRSPEEAASYVLGQKSAKEEWIDSNGKGLLAYYKELSVQNQAPSPKLVHPPICLPQSYKNPIFYIRNEGVCHASGIYDSVSGYFFILKDSKIALHVDDEFADSPAGRARERLLSSNCIEEDGYYVVQKSSKCRSATAAASYVMGKHVIYTEWETEAGKVLKDYYPDKFLRKKSKLDKPTPKLPSNTLHVKPSPFAPPSPAVPVVDGPAHMFYIKKNSEPNRECDAKGYYDRVTKKFILMSGSTWSFDVSKAYQYSASELMRRTVIKKNCKQLSGTIIQFKDILCDSPSQAACYVLGSAANGWEEWTDKDGRTMKEVFNGPS